MPHVWGPSTRTKSYLFRFGTDGEGGGSTLWPPIDPGTPFAGTPVGIRFPVSRSKSRIVPGPLIQTVELTSGSPLWFWGPTSRLRPRLLRGPSIRETTATPTDITGTAGLSADSAVLVSVGQQDIYDIGNDTAVFLPTNATMSASSVQSVIGTGVLTADYFTMLGLGSIYSGTDIAGTGIFNSGEATMDASGVQDIIGQAVLTMDSATTTGTGGTSYTAYPPEQVWQVLLEGQLQIIEALRVILASVAGPSEGVGTDAVQYKSPVTGQTRIDSVSADSQNRSSVTIDGTV